MSPRGAQALYRAAQALALVEGRDYVLPDDIKRLAVPVFAHRIAVNSRLPLASRVRHIRTDFYRWTRVARTSRGDVQGDRFRTGAGRARISPPAYA